MPENPVLEAQITDPPRLNAVDFDAMLAKIPQTTPDFTLLKHLLAGLVLETQAKLIVEVGTDVGDSTRIFSTMLQLTQGKLITIDLVPPKQDWPRQMNWPIPNITFLIGDSLTIPLFERIDLLFLDGDHHAEHLRKELDYFGKRMQVPSKLVLHDTLHSEFGAEITATLRAFCREHGFAWTEYPYQHGLAVIEFTHPI